MPPRVILVKVTLRPAAVEFESIVVELNQTEVVLSRVELSSTEVMLSRVELSSTEVVLSRVELK